MENTFFFFGGGLQSVTTTSRRVPKGKEEEEEEVVVVGRVVNMSKLQSFSLLTLLCRIRSPQVRLSGLFSGKTFFPFPSSGCVVKSTGNGDWGKKRSRFKTKPYYWVLGKGLPLQTIRSQHLRTTSNTGCQRFR